MINKISISAVAWGTNRLDVFGLGTDNSMYHKAWDGNAWESDWENLGGVFNSPPSAVAWGTNRLDVFGLGTDNSMYHKAWDGNAWESDWGNLGGVFNVFKGSDYIQIHEDHINFRSGVAAGGRFNLTITRQGNISFSGHFHDSGADSYRTSLVVVLMTPDGTAYSITHKGRTHGTVDPGSRDDDWVVNEHSDLIAQNWDGQFSQAASRWTARVNSALEQAVGDLAQQLAVELGKAAVKGLVALIAA